jgi:hypothetical protein
LSGALGVGLIEELVGQVLVFRIWGAVEEGGALVLEEGRLVVVVIGGPLFSSEVHCKN